MPPAKISSPSIIPIRFVVFVESNRYCDALSACPTMYTVIGCVAEKEVFTPSRFVPPAEALKNDGKDVLNNVLLHV